MLKQKFLIDFGAKLFIYFVTAVTGIVVARVAGPEVIGRIAYGISFVSMFGFIFGLFGTSHIKLISEGQNKRNCIKIYSIITVLSVVVYILVVLGYFFSKKFIYGVKFTEIDQIVIFISLATISIQALYKIPELTFVGLTQQAKVNLPKIYRGLLYNISRIVVVLLGYKAIALVSTNLISSIIILPYFMYLLGKDSFKGKWDNKLFYRYLGIGFPVLVITSTNSFITYYGNVLLKDHSSIKELGYYVGGYSIAGMLLMLGNTAGTIFFPLFSKAYTNNDIEFIRKQINKFEHFLFVFIAPLIISLSIFSNTIIISLLGQKYSNSVPVFSILVFVSFFMIWGMPYNNVINGINKFKVNAILNILYSLSFIFFLVLFVKGKYFEYGAIGLAISMLLLSIIRFFGWSIYSNKKINKKYNSALFLMLFLYILLTLIGSFLYNYFVIGYSTLLKIILFFAFTILVYGILYLIKFMKKEDVIFLIDVVNIKSMRSYIKNEFNEKE